MAASGNAKSWGLVMVAMVIAVVIGIAVAKKLPFTR